MFLAEERAGVSATIQRLGLKPEELLHATRRSTSESDEEER
ncbi:MAG TPA: hypothetical protein VGS98_00165 [Thermoanaerobaculia bacterium]|jgi:hypothetical protein|nr:hypothetical protein [Thermoanaerobaculia bacterium]